MQSERVERVGVEQRDLDDPIDRQPVGAGREPNCLRTVRVVDAIGHPPIARHIGVDPRDIPIGVAGNDRPQDRVTLMARRDVQAIRKRPLYQVSPHGCDRIGRTPRSASGGLPTLVWPNRWRWRPPPPALGSTPPTSSAPRTRGALRSCRRCRGLGLFQHWRIRRPTSATPPARGW